MSDKLNNIIRMKGGNDPYIIENSYVMTVVVWKRHGLGLCSNEHKPSSDPQRKKGAMHNTNSSDINTYTNN